MPDAHLILLVAAALLLLADLLLTGGAMTRAGMSEVTTVAPHQLAAMALVVLLVTLVLLRGVQT